MKTVDLALSLKYKCISSSTWKLAISSLMIILEHGLKVARKHPSYFTNIWKILSQALDNFLFPKRYLINFITE